MSDVKLKHRFVIKHGGRYYLQPMKLHQRLMELEGKSGYDIIEEDFDPTTKDQFAYYYGGIIKAVCMQTEMFAGNEETEIDDHFRDLFLTYRKMISINGKHREVVKQDHLSSLGKKKMAEYITKVIAWLGNEGIECPEPNEFIIKKYTTKERKLED